MHVSFFYPLIRFSVSASVRVPPVTLVCPQEAETRKAVSGNISTNLPGRIRDLLFARILPRDVYFVIEAVGVGWEGEGMAEGGRVVRKRTEDEGKRLVRLHGADTGWNTVGQRSRVEGYVHGIMPTTYEHPLLHGSLDAR